MLGRKFPICFSALLGFVLVISLSPRPAAAADEATRTIQVVKTARPAPKLKVATEGYTVQPNEHLWKILRRRCEGSEGQIARLYSQALRLNPGLDPRRLEPGQVLRLPKTATTATATTAAAGSATAQAEGSTGNAAPAAKTQAATPPASPPEVPLQVRAQRAGVGLSALYAELGEETVSTGRHFIPLKETGQVVLDAQKFPLLQVGGNTRFVLDIDGRIPTQVDGLLAEAGGYRVLRFDAKRGLKGLLDDALMGSGLDVQRQATLNLPGAVEAEVRPDWALTRAVDNREVIWLIGRPEEATSTGVARYLAARGIHVIDVLAPEGEAVKVMRPESGALPDYSPPVVAQGRGEIVSRLLSLLGQGFERNASVSLFGGEGQGGQQLSGFGLRYSADFGFERGGKRYLVDLADLSPTWRALLEQQGYRVLVLPEGTQGREAAAELLTFLGQDYGDGYSLLGSGRAEGGNIRLKVPGLLVSSGQQKLLISEADTDEGLACALSQAGLKVVQLK